MAALNTGLMKDVGTIVHQVTSKKIQLEKEMEEWDKMYHKELKSVTDEHTKMQASGSTLIAS